MATTKIIMISLISFFSLSVAFGPNPLQDFCVADLTSSARMNGLPCKDPATVKVDDFYFKGLDIPGNTTNPYGATLTPVTVAQIPGVNTLGLSLARLDFSANGFIPPHYHPRATESLVVIEGSMEVGFVTSAPGYKHFRKVLEKGDVFVIPVGLIHYQRSVFEGRTVVIAALNSQNPGIVAVTNAVFGAVPEINSDFLAQAYQLDKKTIEDLQAKF